jgi:hypothetical protein
MKLRQIRPEFTEEDVSKALAYQTDKKYTVAEDEVMASIYYQEEGGDVEEVHIEHEREEHDFKQNPLYQANKADDYDRFHDTFPMDQDPHYLKRDELDESIFNRNLTMNGDYQSTYVKDPNKSFNPTSVLEDDLKYNRLHRTDNNQLLFDEETGFLYERVFKQVKRVNLQPDNYPLYPVIQENQPMRISSHTHRSDTIYDSMSENNNHDTQEQFYNNPLYHGDISIWAADC